MSNKNSIQRQRNESLSGMSQLSFKSEETKLNLI